MIDILDLWKEYGNENAPSVKDSFEPVPYAEKEKIAEYIGTQALKRLIIGTVG